MPHRYSQADIHSFSQSQNLELIPPVLPVSDPPLTAPAFSPKNGEELTSAVEACLKLSRQGYCSSGPHGRIGDWDVSSVVGMSKLFADASVFIGDISEWDISRVKDMSGMFLTAKAFDGDISRWDVSRVTAMNSMFRFASSFNGDISEWDVSSVLTMDYMFWYASSFKHALSGTSWFKS